MQRNNRASSATLLIGALTVLGVGGVSAASSLAGEVQPRSAGGTGMDAIIQKVEQRHDARVIEVEREDDRDKATYEVKLRANDGSERELYVDAEGRRVGEDGEG